MITNLNYEISPKGSIREHAKKTRSEGTLLCNVNQQCSRIREDQTITKSLKRIGTGTIKTLHGQCKKKKKKNHLTGSQTQNRLQKEY